MKVQIYIDELYPFYGFHTEPPFTSAAPVIKISEETLQRWQHVMEEFENLQRELRKLRDEP